MIHLVKVTDTSVLYNCDCGIRGECIFRPLGEGPSLLTIRCPACDTKELVEIPTDKDIKCGESSSYSLSIIIFNKIIK